MRDAHDFPAPSPAEPHRLGELDRGPPLTSDGPVEPPWWSAHDADRHYEQLRLEHERRLDADHRQWRRERFSAAFDAWRRSREDGRDPARDGDVQRFHEGR